MATTTTSAHPLGGWRTGLVIAAVVGLAKADASAVGAVAPALRASLHFSDTQLGLLGSIASATGALCALPAGTLVDRSNRVKVLGVALILWSLALGVAGFATGIFLLGLARIVSGGVATVARPVAVSLTGELYHPDRRGRALAALDSGQAVGTAVGFALAAVAVSLLNWRWLFWWLAAAGVLLSVAALRVGDPTPARRPGPDLFSVLRTLVSIRTNVVVIVSDSVGNFFFAGTGSFAVLFFSERFHLSNGTVDSLAPLFAVGVIAGILAGGHFGDRWARQHGGSRRILVAVACQIGAAGLFLVALLSHSILETGAFVFAAATVLGGAGPCLDAVRVDIVPAAVRGRAEAAKGLLTLASSALGPATFGLVATAFGGRGDGIALRDAFMVMLAPLTVGALILLAAVGPYRRDAQAAGTVPAAGMLSG